MATEIAKMVATSKLKQMTGGIEGALGVDSESDAARAKDAEKRMGIERTKRKEERQREKQAHHQDKEQERQKIRDKYALNNSKKPSSTAASRKPSPPKEDTEQTNDNSDKKSCIVS